MKYSVGDKVRIKDDISQCATRNSEGKMDEWQGKIMTVRGIYAAFYEMLEDCGGWTWCDDMIAGLAGETFEEFVATKIDNAIESAKREWEEDHTEIQLVHGQHSIYGKIYTWQNPDRVPVEVGRIVKVETSKGEQPVIVIGTVKANLKDAKQYKKVLGRYDNE